MNSNHIICLPLRSNVPEPGRKDWRLVRCPICGDDCWESDLTRQTERLYPGIRRACTACALGGHGATVHPGIQVKVKEHRYLPVDALYRLCNIRGWYTRGNTGSYSALFAMLNDRQGKHEEMTTERLTRIAVDIAEHSDGGKAMVGLVLHELANACIHVFEVD